jgi:hypothetical protein
MVDSNYAKRQLMDLHIQFAILCGENVLSAEQHDKFEALLDEVAESHGFPGPKYRHE